ncbi:MAG: hypothetical protein A3J70_15245 [Elusimicrobia bacterium RIFCSPHIGHO2_02_FULL_61_10]|nr:MAG: hypothetical protein A2636_02695 [Elusimicrobia bacterium RIFCSPHIGHO2_01_FULL_64_10]OGR94235.1 MAG: hypothetical protein A2902_05610 [Elusimicrobia bacterium RIFCSPLOWO2_01_FULL_64_13]OGS05206.1 MAG: hypothetical protein A3J70_15245 [Elusimicrobia bacterium RIFCSPHIGHO2_02_FULL_61_10]
MAKKKDKLQAKKPQSSGFTRWGISLRGWKVIGGGVLTVIAGFYVLSLTDPAGRNWASTLSPFLLLGGYAAIGIGITLPGPDEP